MKYIILLLAVLSLGAQHRDPPQEQWEAYGRDFSRISEQCTLACTCNPCVCPGCVNCCFYFFSFPVEKGLKPYDSSNYRRFFSSRKYHNSTRVIKQGLNQ